MSLFSRRLLALCLLPLALPLAAQSVSQQMANRPKVKAQLAAIPQLDERLAKLEAGLAAAPDRTSLTATTALYLLEYMKAAKARPSAFDLSIGQPQQPRPTPSRPPSKITDLMSSYGTFAELAGELTRAEALAAEAAAGRDPLAGAKGDLKLAYRSDLDGALMPYRIFVPSNYDKARPWPMIVLLHGRNGDENTFMQSNVLQAQAQERGYIIAAVNGRGPVSSYLRENGAEKDLLDVIALMEKNYSIDKEHIFLTGHSMGGWGTLNLGLEHRDKFAALAAMAGWQPIANKTLETGKKIPVLLTAGGRDVQMLSSDIIGIHEKLKKFGYPTRMVVFSQDDHVATFGSSVPHMFAWFDAHRK